MVQLHRRTRGVSGIYRCEIPDQPSGVNQTLFVGLYFFTSKTSGKQNNLMHFWIANLFLIFSDHGGLTTSVNS